MPLKKSEDASRMDAKRSKMREAAAQSGKAFIDEYTVVAGDSLSAIAANFYGSAAKKNWMAIYEANKDLIGDDPNLILPGQKLKIPKLS